MKQSLSQAIGQTFETKRSKYFYDTYSNAVFEVSPLVFDVLGALSLSTAQDRQNAISSLAQQWGCNEVQSTLDEIRSQASIGVFLGPMPEEFGTQKDNEEKHTRRAPRELLLEITEMCNLQCSYCCFSAKFCDARANSTRNMNEETAIAAIDNYFQRPFDDDTTPTITFYGGEPLLRLDLILRCMEYARQKNDRCEFTMTTNGVLLTLDVFKKLLPFKPIITVSVDGPESIHDRERKTITNHGSHRKVISNLQAIWKLDPFFFTNSIRTSTVISELDDITTVSNYFSRNRILSNIKKVHCGVVEQTGISDHYYNNSLALFEKNAIKAKSRYLRALKDHKLSRVRIEQALFVSGQLGKVLRRSRAPIPRKWTFTNLCETGTKCITVSVQGNYRQCEKTDRLPLLGSVHRGLEQEALRKMEDDFLKLSGPCRSCWALRLCTVCYAQIYSLQNGQVSLSPEIKQTACHECKTRTKAALSLYQEIFEINPKLLQNIKSS